VTTPQTFRFIPRWGEVVRSWDEETRPNLTTVDLFEQRDRALEAYLALVGQLSYTEETPATSGSTITLGAGGTSLVRWSVSGHKRIRWTYNMILGAGGSLAGGPLLVGLPTGMTTAAWTQTGTAEAFDSSAATYCVGVIEFGASSTSGAFRLVKPTFGAAGVATVDGVGGANPFTWAASDTLSGDIDLRIA